MIYGLIYIIVINIIGFALMGIDKQKAKKHKWRISEMTFLVISLLGGGIGLICGMYLFHHKTKKWYFKYGFIFILIIQIIGVIYFGKI